MMASLSGTLHPLRLLQIFSSSLPNGRFVKVYHDFFKKQGQKLELSDVLAVDLRYQDPKVSSLKVVLGSQK